MLILNGIPQWDCARFDGASVRRAGLRWLNQSWICSRCRLFRSETGKLKQVDVDCYTSASYRKVTVLGVWSRKKDFVAMERMILTDRLSLRQKQEPMFLRKPTPYLHPCASASTHDTVVLGKLNTVSSLLRFRLKRMRSVVMICKPPDERTEGVQA